MPGKGGGSETVHVQRLNELNDREATCDTRKIHAVSKETRRLLVDFNLPSFHDHSTK